MPPAPRYWLLKSEPGAYGIDDLARDKRTGWDGVRNYQARNFLRDALKPGDGVLFYHSNAEPPGVAGAAKVIREGYPDPTAWEKGHRHFDPDSDRASPTWFMVDVAFVEKFSSFVTLEEIKSCTDLKGMLVARRGTRLSVQPVEKAHFEKVLALGRRRTPAG